MKQFSFMFMIVALLIAVAACAAPPVSQVQPTAVPAPTRAAAEPTMAAAAEPTQAGAAGDCTLRLATTTSTADSGLLTAILPDFESQFNCKVDVVAVGTGQALEIGSKGDADVVLVHARSQEDKFVADGNSQERFDVMYNDFVIVGPTGDPAKIADAATAMDAFKLIAESDSPFASRGDKSGTNSKELSIWASAGITPTAETTWYNALGQGMGETLLASNEGDFYTLADRGTYLSMADNLSNLSILFGGQTIDENPDKALYNPYGVMVVNPEKFPSVNAEMADNFVQWLISPETQAAIGEFGKEQYGQALFYANAPQ